jgi:uncharacterized protein with HEPN domain
MRVESRELLEDMHRACESIAGFTAGKSFDDYARDEQLCFAVERAFEIVGEALSQLGKREPGLLERITEYRQIIGFRNVLIHAYGRISNATTWDIVQNDLPVLRRELEALLAE